MAKINYGMVRANKELMENINIFRELLASTASENKRIALDIKALETNVHIIEYRMRMYHNMDAMAYALLYVDGYENSWDDLTTRKRNALERMDTLKTTRKANKDNVQAYIHTLATRMGFNNTMYKAYRDNNMRVFHTQARNVLENVGISVDGVNTMPFATDLLSSIGKRANKGNATRYITLARESTFEDACVFGFLEMLRKRGIIKATNISASASTSATRKLTRNELELSNTRKDARIAELEALLAQYKQA